MLILTLLSTLLLTLFSSNFLVFPILLLTIFIYYLSNINIFFNSTLTSNLEFFYNDEISLFIRILLFFIIFISYLSSSSFNSYKLVGFVLLILTLFCFQVFNTCHLFSLYFYFEASLIPILYIIIKWGSYPERSTRAIIIISYTLLFGVPIFFIMISIYYFNSSWLLIFLSSRKVSPLRRLLIFLCFAVKLPIYGLHYWLPIAHVEAPTFGSVILASLLLKLGGVGLLRLLPIIDLPNIKLYLLSYFLLFTIYSTVVCCFQSDFKRLIAYSSVSHIIVLPFFIFSNNLIALQRIVLIILLHGLSSSLMFLSVGILYTLFSSRQLLLIRGLVLISPLFSILIVLTFFYTLSAPPFPSYVAEVYLIFSTFFLTPYIIMIFLPFVFFGLVYNLNWLSSILFSSPSNTSPQLAQFPLVILLPFILIFTISFLILFLFFFI